MRRGPEGSSEFFRRQNRLLTSSATLQTVEDEVTRLGQGQFPDSNSEFDAPEAFEPIAPGWRGSAYLGFGSLEETHPEGGAKTSPVCNPSR